MKQLSVVSFSWLEQDYNPEVGIVQILPRTIKKDPYGSFMVYEF